MIRYSRLLREVLVDVGTEAIASGVACISTGFMLSVLLNYKYSVARWIVGLSGGSAESVDAVKAALSTSRVTEECEETEPGIDVSLSPLLKECIDKAIAVSTEILEESVDITHLIVGFLLTPSCIAYDALTRCGIQAETTKAILIRTEATFFTQEDAEIMRKLTKSYISENTSGPEGGSGEQGM
jgi:ATP-dependent Clp protease ATP-binding subunit ClpA